MDCDPAPSREAAADLVPRAILLATFRAFSECGGRRCECVVFWTSPAGREGVDECVHPIHRRSPYGYELDDHWLNEFWFRLGSDRRRVLAQVHTHPGAAFHSGTDDEWPIVTQTGFISIVLPDFGIGAANLDSAWTGVLTPCGWSQTQTESLIRIVE